MNVRLSMVLAGVVWLAGCGTPGAPRPPSLKLPQRVSDLAATRVGSTVTLTWTEPQRTTDGETIGKIGPTLVCIGVNDFPMTHCDETVADLSQPQFASCAPKIGQPVTCAVNLSKAVQVRNPLGLATYAVEVMNTNGRSAGLSNQVRVPTAPSIPAASDVGAEVVPGAIVIGFKSSNTDLTGAYHVFRSEAGKTQFIDLGEAGPVMSDRTEFVKRRYGMLDRSFEWEQSYVYRIVGITTVHLPDGSSTVVEGDPSAEITVFAHDIFAPAVPTGLQAVASGVGQPPFIDLTWAPNTESDLAGYNVYRHEEGQGATRINTELVKAPAYRDEQVERGHKYFYAVTSVDLRGNESAKSAEGNEVVQ